MENTEEKNKKRGLFFSIGFHLLLLLVFAFFGLTYTIPPPEEEGITINFGFDQQGQNNNLQNKEPVTTPRQEAASEVEPVQETPQEVVEEIVTQNTEDAPAINRKKEEKKEVTKPKEEPKPDKQLSSAIDKWKNKKEDGSPSDGNTGEAGNQGSQEGDPNSGRYVGGGSGDGFSFNLSGRKMLQKPTINDQSQEEGKVVVDIIVDRYGKVIRAKAGARGSNTTSSYLNKKAEEAALQTRFNANPDAAEEQKGQMTFIFILN